MYNCCFNEPNDHSQHSIQVTINWLRVNAAPIFKANVRKVRQMALKRVLQLIGTSFSPASNQSTAPQLSATLSVMVAVIHSWVVVIHARVVPIEKIFNPFREFHRHVSKCRSFLNPD